MKWKFIAGIIVLSLGVFVLNKSIYAHEKGSHKGSMIDGEITAEVTESGAINVGNVICPVSGELIANVGEGQGVQIEHNGKIYNVCCKFCAKDFRKNPDKFIKIIEDNLAEGKDLGVDDASDYDEDLERETHGYDESDHGHHAH